MTIFPENVKNALLVARVPKVIDGVRSYIGSPSYPRIYEFSDSEIATLIDVTSADQQAFFRDNLTQYTTSVLTLTKGTTKTSHELCNRELCCSFHVNRTFNDESANSGVSYYRYRIAVFDGVRSFYGGKMGGTQTCSVISCTNDTLASCGLRFAATDTVVQPTLFNSILISGNFPASSTTMQMPNSLTTDILPLNASDFTFDITDSSGTSARNIKYNLTTAIRNLLTFAIYGRNFSADSLQATGILKESTVIPLSP